PRPLDQGLEFPVRDIPVDGHEIRYHPAEPGGLPDDENRPRPQSRHCLQNGIEVTIGPAAAKDVTLVSQIFRQRLAAAAAPAHESQLAVDARIPGRNCTYERPGVADDEIAT